MAKERTLPFVKLDAGILNSTLWVDREAREIFITALLLAEPFESTDPIPQLKVRALEQTGFAAPPGWYGFVHAAGVGILRRALVGDELGLPALERLGDPDPESRSAEHEGRRLIRVDGGYLVLNYMKYRERDYTMAERSRRYRERKASRRGATESRRDITQAEAEAEAEPKTIPNGIVVAGKPAPCPVQAIIALYHEVLPDLPRIVKLTDARRSQIRQRWNEGNQDMAGWRSYFEHVSASPFLMGKQPPRNGSSVPFVADLEWLTKAGNFAKVIEGKYHRE